MFGREGVHRFPGEGKRVGKQAANDCLMGTGDQKTFQRCQVKGSLPRKPYLIRRMTGYTGTVTCLHGKQKAGTYSKQKTEALNLFTLPVFVVYPVHFTKTLAFHLPWSGYPPVTRIRGIIIFQDKEKRITW